MKEKMTKLIKNDWFLILVIAAMFMTGWYISPNLPDRVPTHWNIAGEVDNYGPKSVLTLWFPLMNAAIYLMMLITPLIDPKKKNYDLFQGTYKLYRWLFVLFFAILYGAILGATLGYPVKIDKVILISIGVLFMIMGNYMGKIKQNFFVGIKTPWTLSNSEVWNKTHRLSGILWVLGGLFSIIIAFSSNGVLKFSIFIGIMFLIAIIPILYSYILYKKEGKEDKKDA